MCASIIQKIRPNDFQRFQLNETLQKSTNLVFVKIRNPKGKKIQKKKFHYSGMFLLFFVFCIQIRPGIRSNWRIYFLFLFLLYLWKQFSQHFGMFHLWKLAANDFICKKVQSRWNCFCCCYFVSKYRIPSSIPPKDVCSTEYIQMKREKKNCANISNRSIVF